MSLRLFSVFTNVDPIVEGDILYRSDQYFQLGCDLRDLTRLNQVLSSVVDIKNSLVMFTAEVSITYMNVEASDALIKWASTLPEGKYSLSNVL